VSTTWRIHDSFDSGVGFLGFLREYWEIGDKVGWIAGFAGGATRQYQALDSTDWSVLLSTDNADFLITGLGDRDDRPWSVASYVYQEFWKGSKEGQQAHIMMGASYAREGPSFANWNYFVSVEAIGLVPPRAGDRMGAAFSYNNLSPDLQSLAATVGIGLRDAWNVELYYNVEVNKWLHMTADFQLVENGRRGDNLAVIPGVRAVVDF
jgi:hypothetical protein